MPDATTTWMIKPGAVGALALGKPIPAALHDKLEGGYAAMLIADGVAIDAFQLDQVLVAIEGGPFAVLDAEGKAPPPPARELGARGAAAARGGAVVSRLFVTGAVPRTAAGVGVGSDLAALRAAYPDVSTHVFPPTRGNDRCAARTSALPDVMFVFESCDAATAGAKVIRVDLLAGFSE